MFERGEPCPRVILCAGVQKLDIARADICCGPVDMLEVFVNADAFMRGCGERHGDIEQADVAIVQLPALRQDGAGIETHSVTAVACIGSPTILT